MIIHPSRDRIVLQRDITKKQKKNFKKIAITIIKLGYRAGRGSAEMRKQL